MNTYVALLRGINVGGKNKLPMADLAAIFRDLGCDDVRTYIQSGNVVYRAPRGLADAVSAALLERHGLRVPVVTRTAEELVAARDANPFLAEGAPEETLHVAFLADLPSPEAVVALDPARSPPDRFVVSGREVYLCLPNGMARTRITNDWLDRGLRTVSTGRNWRTVNKLVELTSA